MENNRRGNQVAGEPGGIITGAGSGDAVKEPVSALPLPPTWFQRGPQSGTRGCRAPAWGHFYSEEFQINWL